MAAQWGNNSLAPDKAASWAFVRNKTTGFLPVLQVTPLSPSFTSSAPNCFYGYPTENQLGISTIWSQLTDDSQFVVYYMVVENLSNSTIEDAFLEADL